MDGSNFGFPIIDAPGELKAQTKRGVTVSAGGVFDYKVEDNQENINESFGTRIGDIEETLRQIETAVEQIENINDTANRAEGKADDIAEDVSSLKLAIGNANYKPNGIPEAIEAAVYPLQEQFDTLLFGNVKVTCTASKANFYKGFPINITITGSTGENASDVDKIWILDGDAETISNPLAQGTNVQSVDYSFNSASASRTFKAVIKFGAKYNNKQKQSSVLAVTARNPIFYGHAPIDLVNDWDPQDFTDSKTGNSNYLYSKNSPVADISGRTVSFECANTERVFILTTNNKLGAEYGILPFPLYRYSVDYNGIGYFLYVSQNTYSTTLSLTFNSNKNY